MVARRRLLTLEASMRYHRSIIAKRQVPSRALSAYRRGWSFLHAPRSV